MPAGITTNAIAKIAAQTTFNIVASVSGQYQTQLPKRNRSICRISRLGLKVTARPWAPAVARDCSLSARAIGADSREVNKQEYQDGAKGAGDETCTRFAGGKAIVATAAA
jgi:hypothetical protein